MSFKIPSTLKALVGSVVQARSLADQAEKAGNGQGAQAYRTKVDTILGIMASMPNTSAPPGSDGMFPGYGSDFVNKCIEHGREKALEAIEAAQRKARNAAIEAAQAALRSEAENLNVTSLDPATVLGLAQRCQDAGANLAFVADGENLSLTVLGLKSQRGGNKGGGKPAKTQPRPFVTVGGDERVIGSLSDWAAENLPPSVLSTLDKTKTGKLKGGKKLERFLLRENEVNGSKVGPWLREDGGEDYQEAFAAWQASRENDSDDDYEDGDD